LNDRSVILLAVYAAVLGWCAHTWWRNERRSIAWEAAEKVREQNHFEATLGQRVPPAAESPTT
jgi:hypothetical protein